MKFDWSKYYDLASELVSTDTDEAKQRSSISRAYYAAFCLARNYLKEELNEEAAPNENVHQFVADRLKNATNKTIREIGKDLSDLRRLRNKADYQDTIFKLNNDAKFALKLAKNIIEKIEELRENIIGF